MFYYLYEIKNNLNGKIYVGVHKTKNLDDGYMGSGKVINRAIAKHGVENFIKVILEQFTCAEAMFAREKEIVTEEFLSRPDVYNLRRGGSGGFDYINKLGLNNKNFNYDAVVAGLKKAAEENKRKGWPGKKHLVPGWKIDKEKLQALAHSPAATAKRKETYKEIKHGQGVKNSQFGTMWITNDQENKKIKNSEPIPSGWRRGRII